MVSTKKLGALSAVALSSALVHGASAVEVPEQPEPNGVEQTEPAYDYDKVKKLSLRAELTEVIQSKPENFVIFFEDKIIKCKDAWQSLGEQDKKSILRDLFSRVKPYILSGKIGQLEEGLKNNKGKEWVKVLGLSMEDIKELLPSKEFRQTILGLLAWQRYPHYNMFVQRNKLEMDYIKYVSNVPTMTVLRILNSVEYGGIAQKMDEHAWEVLDDKIDLLIPEYEFGKVVKTELRELSKEFDGFNPLTIARVRFSLANIMTYLTVDETGRLLTSQEKVRLAVNIYAEALSKSFNKEIIPGKAIVFATPEKKSNEEYRFATKSYVQNIKAKSGAEPTVIRSDEPHLAHLSLYNTIRDVRGSIMLQFDTHGGRDGKEISITKDEPLSVINIADIMYDKAQNSGDMDIWKNSTVVFSTCYSSDIAENLANELIKRGVTPPTIIFQAQSGQYGFSDFDNQNGSRFDAILGNDGIRTIGQLLGVINFSDFQVDFNSSPGIMTPIPVGKTIRMIHLGQIDNGHSVA